MFTYNFTCCSNYICASDIAVNTYVYAIFLYLQYSHFGIHAKKHAYIKVEIHIIHKFDEASIRYNKFISGCSEAIYIYVGE